ncbi:heavy-metal-associated domain-containing protein [Nocardia cyriacigeorgica]|uniref:Copper-ion-binding protein n=1 Tax=Nocardia cyriacigeorgica TaxID=135487 RepID=A0A4U8WB10_9NOCA|nr:copper ion binding protein [Nocardia cyriacigeorgica]MBF6424044.1 heavy-metal-associated domain-containing protein [Nocardia cyriacigeorgica]TLF56684.1 heavy-metal-associated domain-containing protein [Nocardia cyriacigeorgica]TLF97852.1 heavy-metal-associated domain-containing protein [Nocardia cyriacigeorgica]VFA98948.1 Copper-ion-binding protein [Nocardia cyriacigeorgica]
MSNTITVTVRGMTCGHCASSVREEVGRIDGVTSVAVDLASGLVTIDSAAPVEPDAIAAAVDEAGYELAD